LDQPKVVEKVVDNEYHGIKLLVNTETHTKTRLAKAHRPSAKRGRNNGKAQKES
jgi:hypothetical protein